MNAISFTEDEILTELDLVHRDTTSMYHSAMAQEEGQTRLDYTCFLDLEHGYCETAGSRIHLYADTDRWAIVMEKSGFMNRAGRIEAELIYIGNCIDYPAGEDGRTSNMTVVEIIGSEELERIENTGGDEMECFERVGPEVREIKVKGQKIPFENDYRRYELQGIDVSEEDNPRRLIGFGDLIRYLDATGPAAIHSTEAELRQHIPADLPKLVTIDEFEARSLYSDTTPPSQQETFQLIAKALASNDAALWKPTREANNHWKNWESGTL